MSDPRQTPANGRVAAERLRGTVAADTFSSGAARQVAAPVADLLRAPGGARDRQLIRGAGVTVYEEREGWAFVEAAADGYVGYVPIEALGERTAPTHVVSARASHAYGEPDFKSPELMTLSLGSLLAVDGESARLASTDAGFVPRVHLREIGPGDEPDPVCVAERLLGTPYLWGGNSAWGIDCSGLVQLGCAMSGIPCPGDSDMQETAFSDAQGAPRRGDLLFWKGHVAWVADEKTLLHANVHHMAVAHEPIDAAIARIEAQGDGPVTAHKRPETNL